MTAGVRKARRRRQMTACYIAWPSLLKVEKHGEFGVAAQFVIEVQPLFIRNSFQQFFACVPSYQPKSLLFKPKWIWNKIFWNIDKSE
jgi:hypothetical protein